MNTQLRMMRMTRKIALIFAKQATQQSIMAWIILGFIILAIALLQLFWGMINCEEQKHSIEERYLYRKFAIKILGAILVMAMPTISIVVFVMNN